MVHTVWVTDGIISLHFLSVYSEQYQRRILKQLTPLNKVFDKVLDRNKMLKKLTNELILEQITLQSKAGLSTTDLQQQPLSIALTILSPGHVDTMHLPQSHLKNSLSEWCLNIKNIYYIFKITKCNSHQKSHQQFQQSKTGKIYVRINYFQFPISINIFILSIIVLYPKEYDNI